MASRPKPQPAGPRALTGSPEAKRKAAVILETLAGLRTTQSASDELGIAMVRYYVLETRMLQAMIHALEPQARGRKRNQDAQLKLRDDENRKLQREVLRLQALYRATQRAVGIEDAAKKGKAARQKTTRTRRPRQKTRGERVLDVMRSSIPEPTTESNTLGSEPGGQA